MDRHSKEFRTAIDEITGTSNREVMVMGSDAGGALAVCAQSAADDSVIASIFNTLGDAARRQLTGARGAMLVAGLDGLDADQLLSVAQQDGDANQKPTALLLGASQFLSSGSRDHLVGVGFLSRSASGPARDGIVDSGGTAYYFPRSESRHWHSDFSGMFS
jgi:hypothetical protein